MTVETKYPVTAWLPIVLLPTVLWLAVGLARSARAEPDGKPVDPETLAAAIEGIKTKGGTLQYDTTKERRPVIAVDLNGAGDGNRVLEQVRLVATLRALRLDGSQVNDKGVLEHLPAMKGLRTLSLGARIGDRGLTDGRQAFFL